MLLFKKKFLPAIRAGEKTQTVRIWPVCRMRAGQRSYIPGAGYIRVEAIEPISLNELTEADASRDGFERLADLKSEIERLYPQGEMAGQQAYRIRFCVLPAAEQEALRAEKARRKQAPS